MIWDYDLKTFFEESEKVKACAYNVFLEVSEGMFKAEVEIEIDNEAYAIFPRDFKILQCSKDIQWFKDFLKIPPSTKLSYEGLPDGKINLITQREAELNLYLPWYPVVKFPYPFNAKVRVHHDYELFLMPCLGITNQGEFRAIDLALIGGDVVGMESEKNVTVISFVRENISELLETHVEILEFLEKCWGVLPRHLYVIESLREINGSYGREGLLVHEQGIKPSPSYWIAHEIAHQWFGCGIYGKYDWINEGLAEYSAYLYILENIGQKEAEKFLKKRLSIIKDSNESIGYARFGTSRWDTAAYGGLKVAIELSKEVKEFNELLRKFIKRNFGKIVNNEEFIQFFSPHIKEKRLLELLKLA